MCELVSSELEMQNQLKGSKSLVIIESSHQKIHIIFSVFTQRTSWFVFDRLAMTMGRINIAETEYRSPHQLWEVHLKTNLPT